MTFWDVWAQMLRRSGNFSSCVWGKLATVWKVWALWGHHESRKPTLATWKGHLERGWHLVNTSWHARQIRRLSWMVQPVDTLWSRDRPFLPSTAQAAELGVNNCCFKLLNFGWFVTESLKTKTSLFTKSFQSFPSRPKSIHLLWKCTWQCLLHLILELDTVLGSCSPMPALG